VACGVWRVAWTCRPGRPARRGRPGRLRHVTRHTQHSTLHPTRHTRHSARSRAPSHGLRRGRPESSSTVTTRRDPSRWAETRRPQRGHGATTGAVAPGPNAAPHAGQCTRRSGGAPADVMVRLGVRLAGVARGERTTAGPDDGVRSTDRGPIAGAACSSRNCRSRALMPRSASGLARPRASSTRATSPPSRGSPPITRRGPPPRRAPKCARARATATRHPTSTIAVAACAASGSSNSGVSRDTGASIMATRSRTA